MALDVIKHSGFEDPILKQAWEELSAASATGSIFTTFEWCHRWALSVGRPARPFILRVVQGTQTIGLAPLGLDAAGPVRWLRLMGRERVCGDHLDVLCRPAFLEPCLDALTAYLESHGSEYGGLMLGEVDVHSPTSAALKRWAEARGFAVTNTQRQVVPYIDLPPTFDELAASLSANMRYHVRRRRREFARLGDGQVFIVGAPAGVPNVLSAFFDLHERRWQRDGQAGNFIDPAMRRFLQAFCGDAAARGWLRCYLLQVAGNIHGVLVAFHWGGRAYFYQMGWSPDGPIRSPGVVLLAASIEQAICEGLERYDLLRGPEEYKFKWTSQVTEQSCLLIGRSLRARAVIAAQRIEDALRKTCHRCLGEDRWRRARKLLRREALPSVSRGLRTVQAGTHERRDSTIPD